MNGFAYQVHTNAGADRGDIESAQELNDFFQGSQNLFLGDDDLRVLTANIIGCLPGIFQINGVFLHANGKGADRNLAFLCCHGTDQGRIQTAGQEKTDLGIGDQPLFNSGSELVMNLLAYGFHIVITVVFGFCNVTVAHKFAVFVKMSRWEGHDMFT